jgi:GxxExxY protein
MITKKQLNHLIYEVTGASIEVHRNLGPGLLESIYQDCLAHELTLRGIAHTTQQIVAVEYKDLIMSTPLRCDFFIEDILPLEIKSKSEILPIDQAQIMTYMKLLGRPKGLLINFNVTNLYADGHFTFVNELYYELT